MMGELVIREHSSSDEEQDQTEDEIACEECEKSGSRDTETNQLHRALLPASCEALLNCSVTMKSGSND